MEYKILKAYKDSYAFADIDKGLNIVYHINEHLADGWNLRGDLLLEDGIFYQVMTRGVEEPKIAWTEVFKQMEEATKLRKDV
jgi:hypothetical protein